MITICVVKTAHAKPYLKRLCRHFAHKIPASIEGQRGTLQFPFGVCNIDVDDKEMRIRIEVNDAAELDRAERVVADHLIRMANRDKPEVFWQRAATE